MAETTGRAAGAPVTQSGGAVTAGAVSAGHWVLAATILGSSLSFIDGTAVNVALPALQRDLHATGAGAQWVVEAYALFLAALILTGGALGDRLGRRRVYAVGIALFTLASVWCGLAPTIGVLIAARAVQGLGGALLVPGSLALISAAFNGERRGTAIGTWSGVTTITSVAGPVLGGWLVQAASWRWVFFINVPLALIVLAILARHVPESRDDAQTGRLDWPGAVLATLGLGGLTFGLIQAGPSGLKDPLVLAALGGGLVALVLFVLAEARELAPMLPLTLFRSPTFSGANLLTLLLYGALGVALYYLPFNLQQVQGYTPVEAGAALLPFTIVVFALSRWTGGLVQRSGAKRPLVVGPLLVAAGFLLYLRPGLGGSYWTTFFPAVVVMALGMALVIAPLTTAVMGAVGQEHVGVASGVNNAVSRAAGLLAIAVLGLVVAAAFNSALDGHIASLHLAPATRQALDAQRARLAGARVPAGVTPTVHVALRRAIDASFVSGFRVAMGVSAALAALAALVAAMMIPGRGMRADDHTAVPPQDHAACSAGRRIVTGHA